MYTPLRKLHRAKPLTDHTPVLVLKLASTCFGPQGLIYVGHPLLVPGCWQWFGFPNLSRSIVALFSAISQLPVFQAAATGAYLLSPTVLQGIPTSS